MAQRALAAGARVVITGAAGRHGRLVLARLQGRGYDVVATDVAAWPDCPVPFVQADLCDAAATREIIGSAAGVIHLAAVPGPSRFPPPGVDPSWGARATIGLEDLPPGAVLGRNVASAWNVFESAARGGARRVVFSSSAFAMGWSHDPLMFQPLSFPLDETSQPIPSESYGLSKLCGEEAAAATARATSGRTTIASLRFTNLVYPDAEAKLPWAAPTESAPANALMWCWTKAADVADAHIAALEAPSIGPSPHEAFLLSAPTTRFTENTEMLLKRWYPQALRGKRGPLVGNESVIDASKARRLLNWAPSTVPQLAQ